jgi:hypothetical protein
LQGALDGDGNLRGCLNARRPCAVVEKIGKLGDPVAFEQVEVGRRHLELQNVRPDPEAALDGRTNPVVEWRSGAPGSFADMLLQSDVNRFGSLADIARPAVAG